MSSDGSLAAFDSDVRDKATVALGSFASTLTANFASLTAAQPEDQLKAPVAALLSAVGEGLSKTVVTRTEVRVEGLGGRPDLGVDAEGLPVGNVELKAPGRGARPDAFSDRRSREQWEKFKALPNLIYTDGREWALYRSGDLVGGPISLSFDPTTSGASAVTPDDVTAILTILADFVGWSPVVPSTPKALAAMLAPLTRVLRDEVLADVKRGGVMETLANEWRQTLFPDADDPTFSDGYAQTFTYALLLARLEGAAAPLDTATAAAELDADHALLAQVLRVLGQDAARDAIGMPVGLLERVIGAVDATRLSRNRDPWLYFYEDFLAAYDPVQRNNRGVYYTPIEVVNCQVRLAQQLLTGPLGKADGFANRQVITLDPAAGTGTYPLAIVKTAVETAVPLGAGIVADTATQLSNNLNAFELLVGPYAVTHLRLSRALTDAGATLPTDGVNVFLTDSLATPASAGFAQQATLFQRKLAAEQERASKIKSPMTHVTVVIGNPPYDRDQSGAKAGVRRKGGMVRYKGESNDYGLIEDFRKPLPTHIRGEHGLNLFNDYVYFWRWAIWKTCEQNNDPGLVSFITPSAYLSGPGFAGMREVMRRRFDELWFIDLGGEGRGSRREANVFDGVLTPVVIGIGVRRPDIDPEARTDTPAVVHYRKISGTRAEKLAALNTLTSLTPGPEWEDIARAWGEPFLPEGTNTFDTWTSIQDVFPWSGRGIQFSRSWPVGEDQSVLEERWKQLIDAGHGPDPTKRQAQLLRRGKPSRDARIDREAPSILGNGKLPRLDSLPRGAPPDGIRRLGWRSFDRQFCVADNRVIDMARSAFWRSVSSKQIFFTIVPNETTAGPALVAHTGVPDLNAHNNRGGIVLPLYRDNAASHANVPAGLLDRLTTQYGAQVSAEDVAAYVYGLLGTSVYTTRFLGELESSPPRIPFTATHTLFRQVAALGRDLIWWATYGERFQPLDANGQPVSRLPIGSSQNTVPVSPTPYPNSYEYTADTETLTVGTGVFKPIPPAVWHYEVSGLRIVESWIAYRLKDRAGKASSDLDNIRPDRWTFSRELLELLAIIEHLVAKEPAADALLKQVISGKVIDPATISPPTAEERQRPAATPADDTQAALFS